MKRSEWAETWWNQGLHELAAARALRQDRFYDVCALMCQQAVEKAVKALWIDARGTEPPRVHWIEKLTEELGAPEQVIDDCAVLVADYTASRYPSRGTAEPHHLFEEVDADDRLKRAEAVIAWAETFWEEA